jgi:hypothetical protein
MHAVVISRIFASVLIVLTLSPVTAPFSTCELGTFFTRTQAHQVLPLRLPFSNNRSASAPGTVLPVVGTVGARVRLLTFTTQHVSPAARMADATFRLGSLANRSTSTHSTPVTNLRL